MPEMTAGWYFSSGVLLLFYFGVGDCLKCDQYGVSQQLSCPQPGQSDSFLYCCGEDYQRYCCDESTKLLDDDFDSGGIGTAISMTMGLMFMCCGCCFPCCYCINKCAVGRGVERSGSSDGEEITSAPFNNSAQPSGTGYAPVQTPSCRPPQHSAHNNLPRCPSPPPAYSLEPPPAYPAQPPPYPGPPEQDYLTKQPPYDPPM